MDVARDHLKGNLLLALESTSSRMSRAAREEMTLGRHMTTEEINRELDRAGPGQIRALAERLFTGVTAALAVVGRAGRLRLPARELEL